MRFSFIIPAKNEEDAIALCINSIHSQNFDSCFIDIIVIDDYSSDNTLQVAKSLGALVITPNLPYGKTSRAKNKNFAVQYAKGDYIIFLDAHIILPTTDWLMKVSMIIKQNSERSNLLASFPALPPPELAPLLKIFKVEEAKKIAFFSTTSRGLNQFVGGSMLIKKEFFMKLGGFPEMPVSEDVRLYKKAIANGVAYYFLPELWVWHLDKKLFSVKNWIKRNLKEGFYSTIYYWDNIRSDKFGLLFSILLGLSFIGLFLIFISWLILFSLFSIIFLLHFYHAIGAFRRSDGTMPPLHLLGLIIIGSVQALLFRISVTVGIFVRLFRSLKRLLKHF